MIEECNFKYKSEGKELCLQQPLRLQDGHYYVDCQGKENCILFQIYKKVIEK